MNVLFVCTGNTCRSPMAQALLQKKANVNVQSAGLFASSGDPASQGTRDVLQASDISINHKSQPVTQKLLDWADLILTMTMQHKQALTAQYPEILDKVYTLKEYTLLDGQATWELLKQAYARLEEKRLTVVTEVDHTETEQQLRAFLREEQDEIERLEAELPNYDISDPFGGDQNTYQETLAEIEKYIDILAEKLENKEK